ncbi:MAG TPA: glutamyl-tRNA reductase [Thermoanaerobaculia bacterium]|nr:glutamyl-tRNA reductase [Thermoanaerobaculia bacterium]
MPPIRRDAVSPELPLLLVGVDHRSAPLDLRERVAYAGPDAEDILIRLIAEPSIEEALLLSTCNRTEVYLRHNLEQDAFQRGLGTVFLGRAPEIKDEGRFYVSRGDQTARHLLAVACGLESMILGEPEILGQVRSAAALAEGLGTSGAILRRCARSAAAAGRRVRTETAIGEGAVSFGYASVELARSIFTSLEQCTILLIGAGETALSVARSLVERGARELLVANRSRERAEAFVREFPSARLVSFETRQRALERADLVVAATSAPEPILRREDVELAMRQRRSNPLLIVDLGVPRDVDPSAGELGNVFLHDVDSLEQLIERNLRRRRDELPKATQIVEEELERLLVWYDGLEAEPVVAQLHRRAEEIRSTELASRRDRFPTHLHGELESLTRAIVRKILHHPSARLRDGADMANLHHLAALRDLFRLDDD